jgi:carbon-monoxide dehydrogenase small subunit
VAKQQIRLVVNRKVYEVTVKLHQTLVELLREDLNLTGAKYGCGQGECGSCTVLVEGKPVLSCLTLAVAVDGKEITTIEGLEDGNKLHPIQESFIENHGMQCGYCTPGIIMSAKALLDENPDPTEQQVRRAISGNLCRCGTYAKIVKSILAAAKKMRGN